MGARTICLAVLLGSVSVAFAGVSRDAFDKWLNEDVTYITSCDERWQALKLTTDNQRQDFIEQFWLRRDPTPDTPENEYKKEHYRRIAYSNSHFASELPGWKTGRGRIYVVYGPPDEISSYPGSEVWHYRYIEGLGKNVEIRFSQRNGEEVITGEPEPEHGVRE